MIAVSWWRNPLYGDVRINGKDVEVKFSRQKEDGGFLVNQIRPQDYEFVALVILMPKEVHIATVPKDVILSKSVGQHGGNLSTETFIYTASKFAKFANDFGCYFGMKRFRETFML